MTFDLRDSETGAMLLDLRLLSITLFDHSSTSFIRVRSLNQAQSLLIRLVLLANLFWELQAINHTYRTFRLILGIWTLVLTLVHQLLHLLFGLLVLDSWYLMLVQASVSGLSFLPVQRGPDGPLRTTELGLHGTPAYFTNHMPCVT